MNDPDHVTGTLYALGATHPALARPPETYYKELAAARDRILADLTDRRGFRQTWDDCDPDTCTEIETAIYKALVDLVAPLFRPPTGAHVVDDPTGTTARPIRYTRPDGRETADVIRETLGDDGFWAWCMGNALKYHDRAATRLGTPACDTDLAKARFYIAMANHVRGLGPDPRSYRAPTPPTGPTGPTIPAWAPDDVPRRGRRGPRGGLAGVRPPVEGDPRTLGGLRDPRNPRGSRMPTVLKALKLLPVLASVLADVEAKVKAAKDPASAGGAKVTALEVGKIVIAELGPLVEAIVHLIAPDAA